MSSGLWYPVMDHNIIMDAYKHLFYLFLKYVFFSCVKQDEKPVMTVSLLLIS